MRVADVETAGVDVGRRGKRGLRYYRFAPLRDILSLKWSVSERFEVKRVNVNAPTPILLHAKRTRKKCDRFAKEVMLDTLLFFPGELYFVLNTTLSRFSRAFRVRKFLTGCRRTDGELQKYR